jgi:hypothetical protein
MGSAGRGRGDESASLKSGSFFLIEERSPEFTYEMFGAHVANGKHGFVITRDLPSEVRRKHDLPACQTLWVTNLVGPNNISPTSIGLLLSRIIAFFERNHPAVVVLDGVEHLISQNSFDRIMQLIHQVRDMVLVSGGTIIMPLDTRILEEKQLALLERDLEVIVPSPRLSGRKFVFELEDGMLKVMNENAR